jgi:hypothetical protein
MNRARLVVLAATTLGCLVMSMGGCARQKSDGGAGQAATTKPVELRMQGPVANRGGDQVMTVARAARGSELGQESGRAAGGEKAEHGFPLPTDKGGKLVTDVLNPIHRLASPPEEDYRRPRRLKGPLALEEPKLPLPAFQGLPPRLPLTADRPLLPRPLAESPPLDNYRGTPAVPQALLLPAGSLVRQPSPALTQPLPLPLLGQYQPDRRLPDDPTAVASSAAALAQLAPERSTPAPFVPERLPDPFEHASSGRLRHPPEESPVPLVPLPRPPVLIPKK